MTAPLTLDAPSGEPQPCGDEQRQRWRALLKDSALLSGADADALTAVLSECPVQTLDSGSVLIAAGEPAGDVYFVLEGCLGVHVADLGEPAVYAIGPGETAGELSLLDDSPRSAWVVAQTPATRVAVLKRALFWHLIEAWPCIAVNLLNIFARRVRGGNLKLSESRELQQLYARHACTDALTGLHNRRWLDELLPRQMRRAELSREPLAVLMIDVDHFKAINDAFGHRAGDVVLFELGKRLQASSRPTDLLARYGGEEFTVVLPSADIEGAAAAAERIRAAIAEANFMLPEGTALPRITISIGVAAWHGGETAEQLLARGDRALYAAKHGGRNCVSCDRAER